jgi:hypothetical protein
MDALLVKGFLLVLPTLSLRYGRFDEARPE